MIMYKRILLLAILCLFISNCLIAQNAELDSMVQLLSKQEPRVRLTTLLNLSSELKHIDREMGEQYVHEGRKLAEKYRDTAKIWLGNIETAFYKRVKSEYDSAVLYATESLQWAEIMDNDRAIGASANSLGKIFSYMANPEKSIFYNKIALQKAIETEDFHRQNSYKLSIGNNYYDFFKETEDTAYLDTSGQYYLASAMGYLEEKDSSGYFSAMGNMTNVFRQTGQHEKSLQVNLEELDYRKKQGNVPYMIYCTTGASAALHAMGRSREAIFYDKMGAAIADSLEDYESLWQILTNLRTNYRAIGDYQKEALTWERLMKVDSLLNAKDMVDMSYDLEAKYQNEKKSKELAEQQLELRSERERNRYQLLGFVFVLLLLGLIGGIVFLHNRYRQNIRMQKLLAEQQKKRFSAVIEAEEKERTRIARDLHDGLGQLLSTAKMNVSSLDEVVESGGDGEDQKIFDTSVKLLDEAANEVRQVSHNLMPYALKNHGLVPALREMAAKINAGRSQPLFKLEVKDYLGRLSEEKEIALYRICQEIINNSLRHSGASHIRLSLEDKTNGLEIPF